MRHRVVGGMGRGAGWGHPASWSTVRAAGFALLSTAFACGDDASDSSCTDCPTDSSVGGEVVLPPFDGGASEPLDAGRDGATSPVTDAVDAQAADFDEMDAGSAQPPPGPVACSDRPEGTDLLATIDDFIRRPLGCDVFHFTDDHIYWSTEGGTFEANLEGGELRKLFDDELPCFAVDGDAIYTQGRKYPLDGDPPLNLLTDSDLLKLDGDYLYWARVRRGSGEIVRTRTDPDYVEVLQSFSSTEVCWATGSFLAVYYPRPIPVFRDAEMYWLQEGNCDRSVSNGMVLSKPKDGSDPRTVLASLQAHPRFLAIDGDYLYWTNFGSTDVAANYRVDGSIVRKPLAGGSTEILVTGLNLPESLAVGPEHIYFPERAVGETSYRIERIAKDGSGGRETVAQGLAHPVQLSIQGPNLLWVDHCEVEGKLRHELVRAKHGDCTGIEPCDVGMVDGGVDDDAGLDTRGCGNGSLDGSSEECDGTDLGGATCEALGLGSGLLLCDPISCVYDTSMCSGIVSGGGGTGG